MLLNRIFLPVLVCICSLVEATPYSYTYLNNSDAGDGISSSTFAHDINNKNKVAGWYRTAWPSSEDYGFVYHDDIYTTIEVPNAKWGTYVYGINDSDQIVGAYVDDLNTRVHSFLYDGSTFTTLDHPNAGDVGFTIGTQAYDINNNGQVVGLYGDIFGIGHGFLYNGHSFITLNPPNSNFTSAVGINDSGIVVGYFFSDDIIRGFSYDGTDYTVIDNPYALAGSFAGTVITSINNAGMMTGYIVGKGENMDQGFIFDGNSFIMIDVPNSNSARILGSNDNGLIVGNFINANTFGGFLATPNIAEISEPPEWSLMLLGIVLMIILIRNRRLRLL